jgi:gliding motility-associated-like protein
VPSNYTYQDWFGGTTYIYCCFGRTTRNSTTYIANGLPSNPRMYAYDIALQCSDKLKKVRSISIQIISGSNVNSRTFVMAVSGVTYSFSSLNFPKNIQCTGPGTGSDSLAVQGSDAPFTYLWNTTNADTTPQIDSLNAGTYLCTITDAGGCIYKDSVTITETLSPIVIANASNDTITQGDTTILSVIGLTNYVWSNSIGNNATNVSPDSSSWFTVSGTNNDGCFGIDSVYIFVNPLPPIPPIVIDSVEICQLKIPNVFTPGSDTINNVLKVTCTQTNSIQLSVFNRWGNKIFESSNYQNNWDASTVDAGVYYYLLYYGTLNENRKGFIEVIK